MTLTRLSEQFSPLGNMVASGILNQLGRPEMHPLEVLVREAAQNCWDAKREDSDGVRVEISRSTLDNDQMAYLRDQVLTDPPEGLDLAEVLRGKIETLSFADFGTHGLLGPTLAGQPGEFSDFVDFIRNIGQPPDKEYGAGSFGYGKAAFYIASRAKTVIVDTLTVNEDGELERRLIGYGIGDAFWEDGHHYTGRHWWGRDTDAEPALNETAEEIAEALGMPARDGYEGQGTTVMIIAPDVDAEDEVDGDGNGALGETSMEFLADAIVWNFWPRLIRADEGSGGGMQFDIYDNGEPVRIPNPVTHDQLRGFIDAFRYVGEHREQTGPFTSRYEISSQRPKKLLGELVLQRVNSLPVQGRGPLTRGARLMREGVHHVALMRKHEGVVQYLEGDTPVDQQLGYAGVFKADIGVDDVYRDSEPPTHDAWSTEFDSSVPHGKTFVRVGLREIKRHCRDAAGLGTDNRDPAPGDQLPLGEFADSMGALMPGSTGPGARVVLSAKRPGKPGVGNAGAGGWTGPDGVDPDDRSTDDGADSTPMPLVRGDTPVLAQASDGAPVVRYPFDLRTNSHRVGLELKAAVMTNEGTTPEKGEAPAGLELPSVRTWIDPHGTEYKTDSVECGPDGADGEWAVEVEYQPDSVLRLQVRVSAK